jgi:tetratricopeptide (TPR) repeat protein
MGGIAPGAERGPVTVTLARDIERRLGDALVARGIDLRRMDLDAFDFLTVREGEVDTGLTTETKLLVVGWDGGDWEIIDKLFAQGKLPNLKRLVDDGVRAKLLTISPMLSPVIWTSMATGVEPSRHGIIDFVVEDPTDGTRQPVTSAQRQAPTVWEMLSRAGIESGVVGWWATWPADPVRGYLVSDRIAYQLFGFEADPENSQGKTWPPELYEQIRPSIVPPDSVGWDQVLPYLEGERTEEGRFSAEERESLDQFKTLLASGESYLNIATELSERFNPRLEVVYFEGTDTSAHLFMPFRKPSLPGVDPAAIASFHAVVDRYYETADRYLGELLANKDDTWSVMVVSDHGFATDATRPRSTDSRIGHGAAADWHRRFGMLVLSGAHVRPDARIDETSIYDVAPTILAMFGQAVPRSWPGRVLGQALEEDFLERYPVRYRHDDPERVDPGHAGLLDPAAEDLLRKLQSLGYISTAGGQAGESMTAHNNAGVAMLSEGNYEEAAEEFRAGLAASPDAPMLKVNLGLSLRLLGRIDESAPWLREAAEDPTTLRMAGHQLAQMALDKGDLAGAESWLTRILEAEPDAAEIRNTLGLVFERNGDLTAAEGEFRRAAELDPDAAMPRNNMGNLYRRREQIELAEPWYLRAIEADPYFMGAYNNLALVYQARGELDRAIDLYGRALAKSPANAIVLNNLASLYYAQGNADEARELWRRSAAADPSYESPLNNLASLLINDGKYDEAETLLRDALKLDDNYGDARINLALILRTRGDHDKAREQLRLSTRDSRSGIKPFIELGLFELNLGNNAAAIEVLEKTGEAYPPLPAWLNPLGEAYLRAGRPDDALATWRRSLQVQPDQPRVRAVVDSPPWLQDE